MRPSLSVAISFLLIVFLLHKENATAQIIITPDTNSQRLTQYLVSGGVSISNFKFTGGNGAAGFFKVVAATPSLGLDSGIVLSSGYVKTGFSGTNIGINNSAPDGPGIGLNRASNNLLKPGDIDLSSIILPNFDAAVLEFDFVPTGDSIVFRYVFGSEEYPEYNCTDFNDVFAFFISGPGITGRKNIALVPGTNIPVAINSINNGTLSQLGGGDISICDSMGPGSPFLQYYVSNATGQHIAYNGFTKVLAATSRVQPCQMYHLKIAIADGGDEIYDSGVFLEAKSFRSEGVTIQNANPVTATGEPYLVEGCSTGGIRVRRRRAESFIQQISLFYAGSALNTIDVNTLPATVSIAANDSFVYILITPVADLLPEGTERLKIYVRGSNCATDVGGYSDSIEIQIRDYDTLGIVPKDFAAVCRNTSVQLTASPGYNTYIWQPAALLSNAAIRNPLATPLADSTYFICTASTGNCQSKDSVRLFYKKLSLLSKQDVLCKNAVTGQIKLRPGRQWQPPLEFSINNLPPQTDSTFSNLTVGTYRVKLKDITGCTDSILITIDQLFPDLNIDTVMVAQASCTDTSSGSITINASGGKSPFLFSVDGANYQTINMFQTSAGNHFAVVKDINNCTDTAIFQIDLNNIVVLDAGIDTFICEGSFAQLNAVTNTANILWSPAASLSNPTIANPRATPVVQTVYTITAHNANCVKTDSIVVNVYPAPIVNAGNDTTICTGGILQLKGSGGVHYRWSPGTFLSNVAIANPVARPINSITYNLTVTDQNNCSSLQPDKVFVRVVPAVVVFAGNDTTAVARQPVQLRGRQIGDTSANQFTWSPPGGLNNVFIMNPIATLSSDVTYRLTMRTVQGCEGYDDITIKVYNGPEIYVPSGFTPNADGRNDLLRAITVGIKTFKYFTVYNRWGQVVFSTTAPSRGWDGKINGLLQSNQSFVWIAEGISYNDVMIRRRGSVVVIP